MMDRVGAGVTGVAIALLLSACGSGPEKTPTDADGGAGSFNQSFEGAEAFPVIVSSELVVGENRVMIGILDDDDQPIGSPRIDVTVDFFDLSSSASEPVASSDTSFVWTIEPLQGLYVANATFQTPGEWGALVTIRGRGIDEALKTSFDVKSKGATPAVGAPAPTSDTPTIEDEPLDRLTTDAEPDKRFYRMSIAEAVASGRPTVVVFATPKFCTSKVCGPTLEIVKGVAPSFPAVNFVHVEVFELPADPADLQLVPSVKEWGLPSEPWVFVTDDRGRIAAKFEGTVGPSELRAALRRL